MKRLNLRGISSFAKADITSRAGTWIRGSQVGCPSSALSCCSRGLLGEKAAGCSEMCGIVGIAQGVSVQKSRTYWVQVLSPR